MRLFLTFLIVICSHFLYAQKNFLNGFIILKNTKDTINGKVEYLNWSYNPQSILFQDNNQSIQKLTVNELSAFGIYNTEIYNIEKINLDISPYLWGTLSKSPQLLIKKDTLVALSVLVDGDIDLLRLKEQNGKVHFFYRTKNELQELIYHKFLSESNGSTFEVENKKYQKQIDSLVTLCPSKAKKTNTSFNEKELVNEFTKINACLGCGSTCYFKKESDKNLITLGMIAGIRLGGHRQETNDILKDIRETSTLNTLSPIIGICGSISSQRMFGRKSAYFELTYQNYGISTYFYDSKYNYYNLGVSYRNQFSNLSNIKPFWGIGANVRYAQLSSINLGKDTFRSITEEFYFLEREKITPQIFGEIGLSFKKIQVFGRINTQPFLNKQTDIFYDLKNTIKFKQLSYNFCIAYQFLKTKKNI